MVTTVADARKMVLPCFDEAGNLFYHSFEDGKSFWEFPAVAEGRARTGQTGAGIIKVKTERVAKNAVEPQDAVVVTPAQRKEIEEKVPDLADALVDDNNLTAGDQNQTLNSDPRHLLPRPLAFTEVRKQPRSNVKD